MSVPTIALSTMNTVQFCKQNIGEPGGKFGYTWNVIFAPSERNTFRAVIVANYYHGIHPVSGNPGKRGAKSVSKCSFGYLTRLPKLPEWKVPKKSCSRTENDTRVEQRLYALVRTEQKCQNVRFLSLKNERTRFANVGFFGSRSRRRFQNSSRFFFSKITAPIS